MLGLLDHRCVSEASRLANTYSMAGSTLSLTSPDSVLLITARLITAIASRMLRVSPWHHSSVLAAEELSGEGVRMRLRNQEATYSTRERVCQLTLYINEGMSYYAYGKRATILWRGVHKELSGWAEHSTCSTLAAQKQPREDWR